MKALRKWNSGRGRDLPESQSSGSADSHVGMQPGAQLRTPPYMPRPLSGRDESHVAQLAAMENYAGHGMYVDVPDAEARALEESALRYAMEQSQQEAAARWVPCCWWGTCRGCHEAVRAGGCCHLCLLQPQQSHAVGKAVAPGSKRQAHGLQTHKLGPCCAIYGRVAAAVGSPASSAMLRVLYKGLRQGLLPGQLPAGGVGWGGVGRAVGTEGQSR